MTKSEDQLAEKPESNDQSRWSLLRDLLVFQAKLFVDGLRDLIMSPVSLVAGLGGLLFNREHPAEWFEKVLVWGQRSEVWINLFGRRSFRERPQEASFDELVGELEAHLIEQYQRGGVTAQAKGVIDKAIDTLQNGVGSVRGQTERNNSSSKH